MTKRPRSDFRRWATDLFDQQLWCWGKDIARPEGNVLLDMGMCRYRSPDAKRGTTLYKATLEGDAEVWLWGFGLLFRAPDLGCIFLRRYAFDPVLVERPPERPVHQPEHLGPLVRPMNASQSAVVQSLVGGVAGWAAGYEHWVAEHLGVAYRAAVLGARPKPPTVPASSMAASWERLAKKSFRLSTPEETFGPWGRLLTCLRCASEMPVAASVNTAAGLEPKKYDPVVRKHVLYREGKR